VQQARDDSHLLRLELAEAIAIESRVEFMPPELVLQIEFGGAAGLLRMLRQLRLLLLHLVLRPEALQVQRTTGSVLLMRRLNHQSPMSMLTPSTLLTDFACGPYFCSAAAWLLPRRDFEIDFAGMDSAGRRDQFARLFRSLAQQAQHEEKRGLARVAEKKSRK
jgi:hypothetical protein